MATVTKQPHSDVEPTHSQQNGYRKNFRTALPQFIAVSVKNLLLMGFGMTLGFSTILIPAVKDPVKGEVIHLEKHEISWIGSINLITVPLGCALSGIVTSPMGRRRAMQAVNLPFFVAWLLFHFSTTTGHLYGAMFLTGLAGGMLEAPALTYVAEVTQPHLRGALTATSSMCIILGVFTQFLFGLLFYWRTVALVNIIFTVLALLALCFIPESPHWLVSRKRHEEARKSLQWLRGWTGAHEVEGELRDIQALFKNKKVECNNEEESFCEKMSWYIDRSFLFPYFLVSYAFFVCNFSGMATLQTYAVSIFQMLEAPIDRYYATLILGIVELVGTGLCVLLVHYTGKRPLVFFSTMATGVCCFLVAGYDGYIKTHDVLVLTPGYINNTNVTEATEGVLINPYSWMPTTLLLMLAFVSHLGTRLLPWILIGEVFSAKTRAGGAGLASAIGYVFSFLANKTYLSMVEYLSIWGTYGLYGFVCVTGCIVFYFILPETEGKKLSDIENHFAGVRRLTNKVYRSKREKTELANMREPNGRVNPTFEGDNTKL